MTVKNINEAWAKVNEIFPSDYNEDVAASERAGYKIYRSSINHYDYICVLGDRLEVNFADGSTVNIWVEAEEVEEVKTVEVEEKKSEARENKKVVTVCFDFGSIADVSVTLREGKTFEECLRMRSERIEEYLNDNGEWVKLQSESEAEAEETESTVFQDLNITRKDVEVIKMLLYNEAMKKKDKTGRWGIEREIFNKLSPITKELLK